MGMLLELVQKTTLAFSEGAAAVEMEQRVPDSVLAEHETTLTGTAVADTTTDYIVSLVVNRAVSSKAMSELEDFYVTGMGTSKSLDSTENGVTKKCFLWTGASVHNCFTNRADSETSTSYTVGDHEDATIEQGRVYAKVQSASDENPQPGNGFGLHLVSVPGHKTTGGLTVEVVEGHFNSKLASMKSFDSFMAFHVVFATSSLSSYKSAFDKDGVKYFAGQWSDSQNSQYSSIIVQVPGSQLLLELVQKTTLSFSEGEAPVQMEQRVPDSVLAEHETILSGDA